MDPSRFANFGVQDPQVRRLQPKGVDTAGAGRKPVLGTKSVPHLFIEAVESRDLQFMTVGVGLYTQLFGVSPRHGVGFTVTIWLAHMLRNFLFG